MKLLFAFFTIFLFCVFPVLAEPESKANTLFETGEYCLEGIRETASIFKFNEDHTFEFFYSYGASDRTGKGIWNQDTNRLIILGSKKPDKDFILVKAKHINSKKIIIKITDSNKMLLSQIYCNLDSNGEVDQRKSNDEGIIIYDKLPITSISLIHAFWPDRFSKFEIKNTKNNYFEFKINPHITEVELNNLVLEIGDKKLIGAHPLIEGDQFIYRKGN